MESLDMSVLVIVPTYNERTNITQIVGAVRALELGASLGS